MAKTGTPLDTTVDDAGFDTYLERRFDGGGVSELEERTGYSYEELQDLFTGGGPSSFSSTIVFTADDEDTISWTSGSINYQDGSKYTVASGTDDISARTYVYFNPNISSTALQTSTAVSDAVDDGSILLAIATNNSDANGKATIDVIGASGGYPVAVSTTHLEAGVMTVPLVINLASEDISIDVRSPSNTQSLRLRGEIEPVADEENPSDTQTVPSGGWLAPGNIESDDDQNTAGNTDQAVLILTDFGFSSVAGAVTGIELIFKGKKTGGSHTFDFDLSGDGQSSWSNVKTSPVMTAIETQYTLGADDDDWGYTWTASSFSDANFAVRITFNQDPPGLGQIDVLTIKVYYTGSSETYSTTQIADIFIGVGGSLIFDLTPGASDNQYFDFRPEDDEYGLVIRESDGTGTTALANLYVTAGTPDYLSINVTGTTDTDAFNITSGDDIGIGTANPLGKLDVYDTTPSNYHNPQAIFRDTTAQAAGVGGYINFGGIYNASDQTEWAAIGGEKENGTSGQFGGELVFRTRTNGDTLDNGEAMRIDASQMVGIGTNAPATTLHVKGSNSQAIRIQGSASNEIADMFVGAEGQFTVDVRNGTDTSARMEILTEDDQYGLLLYESDGTGTDVFANFYVVDNTQNYLSITLGATDTDALNITDSNRLGVGTANPQDKVQVDGNIIIGTGGTGVDYTLTFDGEDNDGVITWMEDEAYFDLSHPLVISDQTLLATPVAGAIEFDNDRMYITNVASQRPIDRSNDVIESTVTVTDTTSETTIFTGAFAANDLKDGNVLIVRVYGGLSTANASDTVTIRMKIGSTTLATVTSTAGNVTDEPWYAKGVITIRSVGMSGTASSFLTVFISGGEDDTVNESTAVDTTVAEDVTITAQWDNADAGNILDLFQGFITLKN